MQRNVITVAATGDPGTGPRILDARARHDGKLAGIVTTCDLLRGDEPVPRA